MRAGGCRKYDNESRGWNECPFRSILEFAVISLAAWLCRVVLQVLGLAALGQRQEVLEQARQVDETTDGALGLVEWVERLPGV